MNKKVCIVALIGRPNTGKSTLMNHLISYELAIVSKHAQTTRDDIKGFYNDDEYQIIFIDTPGIHKGESLLSKRLNKRAQDALKDVDLVLFLSPANEVVGKGDEFIIKTIEDAGVKNKLAIISKVDLVDDKTKLDKKAGYLKKMGFASVFGVGKGHDQSYRDLLEIIKTYAKEDEAMYPEDYISDVSMRFIAKEIIRESAIKRLFQELPHSIAVEITDFIERDKSPYIINGTIYVKKESQKGILIGHNASMIKEISVEARKKMQQIFDHSVFLKVNVKISNNWVNDEKEIKKLGY
ncbi:GTP-binding Era-like protein [Metamycoplasma arthritidis]|uniref:GTPase Era n=1 Tax=Metamycoplasma arthritidis (strain 158L3-1) TaxID=243272 RepID=B3PN14_META1|nr:GTPase Era [Metamycoplasma arthritidis]ACF07416.1 GTP-binding protein Era [Metamycoplasma arthritidis 158L3-1]VEU78938.1 GTP-binding Era-like protein [Metamycoplasma arthritidis]